MRTIKGGNKIMTKGKKKQNGDKERKRDNANTEMGGEKEGKYRKKGEIKGNKENVS